MFRVHCSVFTNETKALYERHVAYSELFALSERLLAVANGDHMAAALHQTMRDRAPDAYTDAGCVKAGTNYRTGLRKRPLQIVKLSGE